MIFKVHGSRGSIPIASPNSVVYGGNTSCYELIYGDYQLIFDTGTGFREVKIDKSKRTFIFYSHWHHDHIQGLAFNYGIFDSEKKINICSALNNKNTSQNIVNKYFSGHYFPLDLTKSLKNLIFFEFSDVQKKLKKDFLIESVSLNHPGGAVGYSIKCNDTKISILLDNEYKNSQFNNLYNFVSGSNLVLWDGMFTNEDLQTKGIWGHSSIEQGVEFKNQCNVKNMLITHHDPLRSDEQLDILAKGLPSGISFAKDGMTFNFTKN